MKSNIKSAVAGVAASLSLLVPPMALAESPGDMYRAELELMKAIRAGQKPVAPQLPDTDRPPAASGKATDEVEPAVAEQPPATEPESKWDGSKLKPLYKWGNMSFNYLDWTSGTTDRSGKTDFVYLELEGGAGWTWGEFYMFLDWENPGNSWSEPGPDDVRIVAKPILDIFLGGSDSGWTFHLQNYALYSKSFYVNNLVPAIAYKYASDKGFWIRAFIGPHYQGSTFYNGWNGWMAGWVAAYDFTIKEQKFTISQWNEFEFDRDEEHYLFNGQPTGDGKSSGINGAIAAWWHPHKKVTVGLQWRYADHKLGYNGYQTGPIFTLKYNF
jgi:hypothetical protein